MALTLKFLATIVATYRSLGRKPEEYLVEVRKVPKGRHETYKCGNMSSLQDLGIAEQTIRRLTPAATSCRPVGTKVEPGCLLEPSQKLMPDRAGFD